MVKITVLLVYLLLAAVEKVAIYSMVLTNKVTVVCSTENKCFDFISQILLVSDTVSL
jgi:hypothetical protein